MREPAIGLCSDCQHSRIVPGSRSTFYMCERAFTDPGYAKYPPLPVVSCPGYQPPPEAGDRTLDDKLKG